MNITYCRRRPVCTARKRAADCKGRRRRPDSPARRQSPSSKHAVPAARRRRSMRPAPCRKPSSTYAVERRAPAGDDVHRPDEHHVVQVRRTATSRPGKWCSPANCRLMSAGSTQPCAVQQIRHATSPESRHAGRTTARLRAWTACNRLVARRGAMTRGPVAADVPSATPAGSLWAQQLDTAALLLRQRRHKRGKQRQHDQRHRSSPTAIRARGRTRARSRGLAGERVEPQPEHVERRDSRRHQRQPGTAGNVPGSSCVKARAVATIASFE